MNYLFGAPMSENLADSCLLLVDRQLQLAHDLAQLLQCLGSIA